MFETIELLDWILEIDFVKTYNFYKSCYLITDVCKCTDCLNYAAACALIPEEIRGLYVSFGIDPTKEGEVYNVAKNDDGTCLYGGFYHITGRIIEGTDCVVPVTAEDNLQIRTFNLLPVIEGYKIGFTQKVSLVPPGFPLPVIQMEFMFNIPWIL
ncbi:MAG: hypothetical protein ABRQ39_10620 [Candidatus Eremiobacterota bacterium]